MKRVLFIYGTLVPVAAFGQPINQGGGGPTGDSALDLDPGSRPSATPPAQPSTGGGARQTQLPPPQPNVIVVGPDGKVTNTTADAPENGYYLSGGSGGGPLTDEPTDSVIHTGATPDLHVVRGGDTLWDISFYYFNDPWQWPKVWSYNPQITNPHWIYPGDLVRLMPRGMFAVNNEPEPEAKPDTVPEVLPAPAKKLEVGIKQTAFVEKQKLDDSITIDGSIDEKVMLGDGDGVYLSYPQGKAPQVGKRYSIYVPGTKAKQGDKVFGAYVNVLGTLEVVSVKQDKRARGVIVQANQEIERGAKVGPLVKTFKNVPPVAAKVDAQGSIVGLLTRDQLIGDGEVVFVSLGKKSGIEVGNRMFVVRRGDAKPGIMASEVGSDDRRFPARALGEIVVVEVGEDISVGLVTLSVQEMSVGDIVMQQVSK